MPASTLALKHCCPRRFEGEEVTGAATENVWVFDARSNVPGITKKDRPLTKEHFTEFEKCYGKDSNGLSKRKDLGEEGRFRSFSLQQVKDRGFRLFRDVISGLYSASAQACRVAIGTDVVDHLPPPRLQYVALDLEGYRQGSMNEVVRLTSVNR